MGNTFDTNRWRTPFNVIRNALAVFGYVHQDIPLIDCAADNTQMTVERRQFFKGWWTPDDNTFTKTLPSGYVGWLNPPYRQPGASLLRWCRWVVDQPAPVVMLLPASVSTRWFHDVVMARATRVVFVKGRIAFEQETANGKWALAGSPRHDSIVVEFGRRLAPLPMVDSVEARWLMDYHEDINE